MSITVTERLESRTLRLSSDGNPSTFEALYNVRGTMNENVAVLAAKNASPAVWGGPQGKQLYRKSTTVAIEGPDLWRATVLYDTSFPAPPSALDSFEFEAGGGNQHVTQSLATIGAYPVGAPDYRGAIGVSDSGVDGVDIVVPSLTMSETHFFPEISSAYKATCADLVGSVNDAPFRSFAAGTILLLGVSGRKENSAFATPWAVTYRYAFSRNRANFSVGDIFVTSKPGWAYMWVRYGMLEDSLTASLLRVPVAVYVEQVYPYSSFSQLGIGTA